MGNFFLISNFSVFNNVVTLCTEFWSYSLSLRATPQPFWGECSNTRDSDEMSRPTPGQQKPRQKNPTSAKIIIPPWRNKPEIDTKGENVRASLKLLCDSKMWKHSSLCPTFGTRRNFRGYTPHSHSKGAARPPACSHAAGGGISRSAVAAWMSTSGDSDKGGGVCAGGHDAAAGRTGAPLQEPTWKAPLSEKGRKAYSTLCVCLSCP